MKSKALHCLVVLMEKLGKEDRREWDRLKHGNQKKFRSPYCSASSRVKKTIQEMEYGV